jgi:hypothetical protein
MRVGPALENQPDDLATQPLAGASSVATSGLSRSRTVSPKPRRPFRRCRHGRVAQPDIGQVDVVLGRVIDQPLPLIFSHNRPLGDASKRASNRAGLGGGRWSWPRSRADRRGPAGDHRWHGWETPGPTDRIHRPQVRQQCSQVTASITSWGIPSSVSAASIGTEPDPTAPNILSMSASWLVLEDRIALDVGEIQVAHRLVAWKTVLPVLGRRCLPGFHFLIESPAPAIAPERRSADIFARLGPLP